MSEDYNCITFHTPACDEHQERLVNANSPKGLDDVCPLCEIERLREFLERGGIDSSAVLAGENDGVWRELRIRRPVEELAVVRDLLVREERLRDALFGTNGALVRMDRAREILRTSEGNYWQLLNTEDIRAALAEDDDD